MEWEGSLGVYYLADREPTAEERKLMAGTSRETSGNSNGKEQGLIEFCRREQCKKVLINGVREPVCTFPMPRSCPCLKFSLDSS